MHVLPIRAAAAAAAAGLVLAGAAAPAHATSSGHVVTGSVECWGRHHSRTLVHFIVYNDTDRPLDYQVTFQRQPHRIAERTYTATVPPRQGWNDGLVIKPGARINYIKVTIGGELAYYRTAPTDPAPRCTANEP